MSGKRFRAHLPTEPEVGDRLVVQPEHIVEEWGGREGGGVTGLVPRRVTATVARIGIVRRVSVRSWLSVDNDQRVYDVMLDDAPGKSVHISVLLTVMGPGILCSTRNLFAFLNYAANRSLTTDEQRVAVGAQTGPWLAALFPDLAGVARKVPKFDDPDDYVTWTLGVAAAIGAHRDIPVPTIKYRIPDDLTQVMPGTSHTVVLDNVTDLLRGDHRAN